MKRRLVLLGPPGSGKGTQADDNNEALERRLEAYWEKTVPVYKYYGNRLVEVDAGRDGGVVFADIAGLIAG